MKKGEENGAFYNIKSRKAESRVHLLENAAKDVEMDGIVKKANQSMKKLLSSLTVVLMRYPKVHIE